MSSASTISSGVDHAQDDARCASCGASLSGRYCSQCGEQVVDHHALTVKHFLAHGVIHEFTHVDAKIFRTFRLLLFRPGFLSAEYFAGRRRRYINPVRLLLSSALIFALLVHGSYITMALGPLRLNLLPPGTPSEATIQETISKLDVLGILSRFAQWRGLAKELTSPSAAEKFNHELKTYGTVLSFSNVGLLALFLFAIYRRRRSLFLEHLVFSLHLAAFVLLISTASLGLFHLVAPIINRWTAPAVIVLVVFLVVATEGVYLNRALLRFYQREAVERPKWSSRVAWATRGAVMLIFLVNSVFITVTYAVGAAIALMRV